MWLLCCCIKKPVWGLWISVWLSVSGLLSAGIFIRWLEWGSQNPPEPTASICVTLLSTLLNPPIQSPVRLVRKLFPNRGSSFLESFGFLCVDEMLAAGATDSRHDCTICLINLRFCYSRVKVCVACSHGDNAIVSLVCAEMILFSQ